jgi:excisionase family DNA binding protein
MEKRLLRVGEAAVLIGFGRTKTYELINRGLLGAVLIDGTLRVPAESIEAFVRTLQAGSKFSPQGGVTPDVKRGEPPADEENDVSMDVERGLHRASACMD